MVSNLGCLAASDMLVEGGYDTIVASYYREFCEFWSPCIWLLMQPLGVGIDGFKYGGVDRDSLMKMGSHSGSRICPRPRSDTGKIGLASSDRVD